MIRTKKHAGSAKSSLGRRFREGRGCPVFLLAVFRTLSLWPAHRLGGRCSGKHERFALSRKKPSNKLPKFSDGLERDVAMPAVCFKLGFVNNALIAWIGKA
jgi:hypothetical protein